MKFTELIDELIQHISTFLKNPTYFTVIIKSNKIIKFTYKQYIILLRRKLYFSPMKTIIYIPINNKLKIVDNIISNKLLKDEYIKNLKKLNNLELYDKKCNLYFWESKELLEKILQIRLIIKN